MNWKNLKNNKCPKCGEYLTYNLNKNSYDCLSCKDFFIEKQRFEEIVNDMYKPKKFQSEDDRLSELNNFDRPEVAEDFSDSPALDK